MAAGVTDEKLKEYFERVESWDSQEARRARNEKRRAYIFGGVASAIALGTIALYVTSPLKTVEPYVIRVDERLGAVDVVSVARDTEVITGEEAVRKFFLASYVRSREAWIPGANEELYRSVMSQSAVPVAQRFRSSRDPSFPRSPAVLYRDGERVNVVIRSVSFLSDDVGQVRFSEIVRGGGVGDRRSDYLATVTFGFSESPTSDAARFYNPLGFVVTDYRVDSELGTQIPDDAGAL
mgnify:CR=1 FL=1|jgi:type IV secretion system protein VirB8